MRKKWAAYSIGFEAAEPEFHAWFTALAKPEQNYCAAVWDAVADPATTAFPLPDSYGVTYLRSLELQGVVSHFHEQFVREERSRQEVDALTDPENIDVI